MQQLRQRDPPKVDERGAAGRHQLCTIFVRLIRAASALQKLTNLPTEPPAHPPRCGAIDRLWLAALAVSPGKGRSLRCGTPLSSASSCPRGVGGFVALALAACKEGLHWACMRHSHHAPGLSDSRMHYSAHSPLAGIPTILLCEKSCEANLPNSQ
eukprot:COSAG02_NODE_3381_length_6837_cov_83.054022_7_plen_155_part_00